MSKYNDIMKKIELTDEMRERVLEKTASAMEASPAVSSEEKRDEPSQPSEMQIKNKDRDKAVKAYSNGGMIFSIVTLAAAVMFFVFGFVMTIKKSYSNDSTSISNVDYNPTIGIPIAGGQITGGVPIDMLMNTGEREDVEQSFENIEELNNALGMNLKSR